MGITESKGNHFHRSTKAYRRRNDADVFAHKNKNSLKRRNETLAPFIHATPLNPSLHGSILNHPFPKQRSRSETQLISYDQPHDDIIPEIDPNQFDSDPYEQLKGAYDYRKHMQRVDEANRPVLEGLCPYKMYVSTNDLRVCDTQRLPPPLRCKTAQGFFRPIPPAQFSQKKTTADASFL
ncbi:unnamed protein product [Adineta ricciae]|uniref:Uncharacterized protein n=1 Tax=Adineta ricciae TaxID=249248 RepID=A0A816ATP1_ADIRI|nr:unnamed protein product [Adineta ricciae]